MYPLFESICIKNGIIQNYEWHQERFLSSYQGHFGKKPNFQLAESILIPETAQRGTFKLRVSYNQSDQKFELERYYIKEIKSLKLVYDDKIDYHLKFTDRSVINNLLESKDNFDDILIVKNGLITDSSYCNIIFFEGSSWFTPQKPLLKGTARAKLLDENFITEADIRPDDIKNFSHFKLINSMRSFEWIKPTPVHSIFL